MKTKNKYLNSSDYIKQSHQIPKIWILAVLLLLLLTFHCPGFPYLPPETIRKPCRFTDVSRGYKN